MHEKEIQENGKVFALSMILMNILIVFAVGGIFGLVQLFLVQIEELNLMLSAFRK